MMVCYDQAAYDVFKEKFKEDIVAFGVTDGGALIQRLESEQGTWSIVLSVSPNRYCLMASGDAWSPVVSGPET